MQEQPAEQAPVEAAPTADAPTDTMPPDHSQADHTHAEVGAPGTEHAAAAHESFFHDPTFWVAVAFVLVVAAVGRKVWGAMSSGLDARAAAIRVQIEEAKKLREDAQALLAEYQKKQRDAMAEAEQIVAQAKQAAARLKVEAEQDLVNAIERRKQQALERIAQSEAQALHDVRNTAIDVALNAAETLIRQNLSDQQKQALADQAITELSKRLN